MKSIIPVKLVISLEKDFTTKNAILIYQINQDGKIEKNKYYTTQVINGIDIAKVNAILSASKIHTEKGEGII